MLLILFFSFLKDCQKMIVIIIWFSEVDDYHECYSLLLLFMMWVKILSNNISIIKKKARSQTSR